MDATIHFLRPWWFLALIPAFVLFLLFIKNRNSSNTWLEHCDAHLLEHVVVGTDFSKKRFVVPFFFFALWSLATIALAGPTWNYQQVPVYHKDIPRVIALDVSESMDTEDVSPSRLELAKYKILDMLKNIKEGQTAMVIFSSESFVVSPLTTDAKTISNLVKVLKTDVVPVQGDNMAKALTKSASLIEQAGLDDGEIILITDTTPSDETYKVASKLHQKGINTNVYAIGTAAGGVAKETTGEYKKDANGNIRYFGVDLGALQRLAKDGGGKLITMTAKNTDVEKILAVTDSDNDKTDSNQDEKSTVWQDNGIWFIWVIIALSLILFRKGIVEKICR